MKKPSTATAPLSPESFCLSRNGWVPNHEFLPVLLYRSVLSLHSPDLASACEALFTRNGWPPQWRDGVYDFHHYHSTAHEVLGFVAGSARLLLGGEGGRAVAVRSGDVALLPGGTGHCCLSASADFLVIGAYPAGQTFDICRSAPDAAALQRIRHLPLPNSDPVTGSSHPLADLWSQPVPARPHEQSD